MWLVARLKCVNMSSMSWLAIQAGLVMSTFFGVWSLKRNVW